MQQEDLQNVEVSQGQQVSPGEEHPPSLLHKLPLEIRRKIYRLLLVSAEPVNFCSPHGLHPSIIRTCRQILFESRILLYSENVFRMKIFDKHGDQRAYFVKCNHFAEEADSWFGNRLKEMRKFEIVVEVRDPDQFWIVKSAVRAVADILSGIPTLKHVHLSLDGLEWTEIQQVSRVLESFTLLRNVGNVAVDGVPQVYTQYLISKMTGCAPLDHLPKMYEALVCFADHLDCCQGVLQDACDAMEDDDVEGFKLLRTEIISIVTDYMENARAHLFDHDASQ